MFLFGQLCTRHLQLLVDTKTKEKVTHLSGEAANNIFGSQPLRRNSAWGLHRSSWARMRVHLALTFSSLGRVAKLPLHCMPAAPAW